LSEDSGLAVLLVEDNPGERWLFAEILRSRGHTVTSCETGDEALEAFLAGRHQLVLLDLILPGIDGLEVCRRIRAEPEGEQPVILVVTGKNEPNVLESVLEAGANDYVAKPVDVAVLNIRLAVAEREVRLQAERERVRAELEVKSKELSTLFSSLPDVFFSVDAREDRLIQVSAAAGRMFGEDPEELVANPKIWKGLLYPGTLEDPEKTLRTAAPGESVTHRAELHLPSGEPGLVQFTLTPHWEEDELIRVDGVVSDVTATYQTQNELGIRNRELLSLFEISELAMQVESFEAADPLLAALSEMTGFPVIAVEEYDETRDAMVVVASHGIPAPEGPGPRVIRPVDTLATKAIETRQPVVAINPHSREHNPDYFSELGLKTFLAVPLVVGTEILGVFVLCHPDPVEIDDRKLRWIESLANTVAAFTDRVRAADDLRDREANYRQIAEQLQRANNELEGFAYSVSHDLRAPLRTMTGFAHALVEDHGDQLSASARDFAQRIITSGRRAEGLISDLLAYSRLSFETLELQPVELSEVIQAVREQLSSDISESNATIEVEGEMPTVMAVGTILTQVLSNLISNAIKFVPPERDPHVLVRSEPRENRMRIWVEDNGVGIPEGQEERIFRVFERLTDNQNVPGTGIGLAIVRRGMERIGGTTGVERRDNGTAFWFEIQERRSRAWRPFSRRR
jgi:PAS domain S-box-containing protein